MPTLYLYPTSPGVCSVLMVAKALGLTLERKIVNIPAGEQLKSEYIKLNPQHTVPTLVDDDGFVLWDSHAIISYLVSKYAKDDSLYPKDLQKRALIDQRLHYENAVIFPVQMDIAHPLIDGERTDVSQGKKEKVGNIYIVLEALLEGKGWIAGDSPSIADYSFLPTISFFKQLIGIDEGKFPRLTRWLKRATVLPGAEVNKEVLQKLIEDCTPKP